MFRNEPLLQIPSNRPDTWIVRGEGLTWATRDDLSDAIIVPSGFVTDLASVPRRLRDMRAFDVNGLSRRPAILHDWLYATGKGGKSFADDVFYVALRSEGVSSWNAWMFYKAVDWFGHAPYREHLNKRAEAASEGRPYPWLVPGPFKVRKPQSLR